MPFYHSFKLLFSSGDGFLQFLYVLYSLWLRHVFLSGTQQRFAFCITSSSFCTTLWAISLCKERGKESMGSVVSVKTPAFPHSLRLHCKWFQNFTTYINIVNLFPVSYISYGYVFALNQKGKAIKWHEQFFFSSFLSKLKQWYKIFMECHIYSWRFKRVNKSLPDFWKFL